MKEDQTCTRTQGGGGGGGGGVVWCLGGVGWGSSADCLLRAVVATRGERAGRRADARSPGAAGTPAVRRGGAGRWADAPPLTSPSCFSSNQPVSFRGRRGWECSRAACASARGTGSLSRGHGGSGEHLERAHYLTLYEALLLTAFHEPPAAVVEPVRGSSGDLLAPGSKLGWRVASR